jgi:hypothetical protein
LITAFKSISFNLTLQIGLPEDFVEGVRLLHSKESNAKDEATAASVHGGSPVAPAQTVPPSRRRRVSLDDEILQRSRRILDGYLRKLGPHLAAWQGNTAPVRPLELNSDGVCYFS